MKKNSKEIDWINVVEKGIVDYRKSISVNSYLKNSFIVYKRDNLGNISIAIVSLEEFHLDVEFEPQDDRGPSTYVYICNRFGRRVITGHLPVPTWVYNVDKTKEHVMREFISLIVLKELIYFLGNRVIDFNALLAACSRNLEEWEYNIKETHNDI